jgi:hypothetical protein
MKVWRVDDDASNFQRLKFIEDIDGSKFIRSFDGTSKKENWESPQIEFFEEDKNKDVSDFPHLLSGFFVVSNRIAQSFIYSFGTSIEVLPINSIPNFSLVHIRDICECVDYNKSQIKYFPDSNKILRIKKFEFIEEEVRNKKIFKDSSFPVTDVYVTDEGKKIIESWNAKGIKFIELWDSEL